MPRGRPRVREMRTCERDECSNTFETTPASPKKYCSRDCGSKATADARAESNKALGRHQPPVCPCGKEVQPSAGMKYAYAQSKKYCSDECRRLYGKKRQRDPANWETKTCQNCGKDFERRKASTSYGKYCSNDCAMKHTKTKRHIVVDDATVLDSGWEALFWGLCAFLKIPVERYKRERGVEWKEGCWYAPDFFLPTLGIAVEIKGVEDDEDEMKWVRFVVSTNISLVRLDRDDLEQVRSAGSFDFAAILGSIAKSQQEMWSKS